MISKSRPKVGIFAGTFDPVHDGHLAFAEHASAAVGLSKVYFLVEPRPRYKQAVKAMNHREQMVRLAIEHHPGLGLIHLPDRQFSVEATLPHLLNRFKDADLCMLMGEDVVKHLSGWPHVDELLKAVQFVFGIRDIHRRELQDSLKILEELRGRAFRYSIVETNETLTSSSYIRRELRLGKVPAAVPEVVVGYIRQHRLYAPVPS